MSKQIEAMKLMLEALEFFKSLSLSMKEIEISDKAITDGREALAEQPAQEPVAMRMPKVGDEVVCIEDDSLGVVAYLTAGGSPEIRFDDGSHGTYVLREFAELFRYTTPQPPAQQAPQFTTGHCKEKAKAGGCQLHNIQCGFPACDRKEA